MTRLKFTFTRQKTREVGIPSTFPPAIEEWNISEYEVLPD
jgi:hypothetical protein